MKCIIGIPARLASSRMKNKPMQIIKGTNATILRHVWERCKLSNLAEKVFVATPDEEIYYHVKSFGGEAILTEPEMEPKLIRPGFRVLHAASKLDNVSDDDGIVVVQGDEPLIDPADIDKIIDYYENCTFESIIHCYTKCSLKEYSDKNEIKVVMDQDNYALYMSRNPIPSFEYSKLNYHEYKRFKQVCIFLYKYSVGKCIMKQSPTILELCEEIEMGRALSMGCRIKMLYNAHSSKSVDTLEDLDEVEKMILKDPIYPQYMKRIS